MIRSGGNGAGVPPTSLPLPAGAATEATLGGTLSWSSVNADSVCHQDTGGTTVTSGTRLWSARFARGAGDRIDLTALGITLSPGEYVTVTMTSTSSVDANVSLTWREEL